jgi:polyisoprenoid-binding protein YceI
MKTSNKTKWLIDPSHTQIQFKVKHLVISNVTGSFDKFEGGMESSREDFADAEVWFSADAASINTGMVDRDNHLRSADFFDAANYPKLTFKSTSIQKKDAEKYKLIGDLTIRGTSHPIELDMEYGGIMKDPWGNTKAGFELTGKFNRKEYGLNWNAITEAGGLVVSEDVKTLINVEVSRQ